MHPGRGFGEHCRADIPSRILAFISSPARPFSPLNSLTARRLGENEHTHTAMASAVAMLCHRIGNG
jgi:hypothetical protein